MFARTCVVVYPSKREVQFVETTTPGLRGQSGGPVCDVNGTIRAVQSRTASLSLGFSPTITHNGKQVTEHQFMHVGQGTHVDHVTDLMDKHGVKYVIGAKP
jgi:hypothetical protein